MLKNAQITNDLYFDENVKTMIRANKEYLLSLASPVLVVHLSYVQANRYDFCRVLRMMGYPPSMFWVLSFINGIEDPNQDIQGMTSFLVIDEQVINNMITRMNTTRI